MTIKEAFQCWICVIECKSSTETPLLLGLSYFGRVFLTELPVSCSSRLLSSAVHSHSDVIIFFTVRVTVAIATSSWATQRLHHIHTYCPDRPECARKMRFVKCILWYSGPNVRVIYQETLILMVSAFSHIEASRSDADFTA